MERRLTALEAIVDSIREDIELQRAAWLRRSREFHDLELAVNAMMTTQNDARAAEAAQYRRLEFRIQLLTLVVGAAAIIAPIVEFIMVSHR
ncbi:MAG: hypothetical protein ACRD2H_13895 [Terriglobales bacterium]